MLERLVEVEKLARSGGKSKDDKKCNTKEGEKYKPTTVYEGGKDKDHEFREYAQLMYLYSDVLKAGMKRSNKETGSKHIRS